MTKADEIAREIAHAQVKTCGGRPGGIGETASMPRPHSVPCDWLTTEIAAAIREAHTSGFNAAREKAFERASMRRFVPPIDLVTTTAADARRLTDQVQQRIATAIAGMKEQSDD